MRLVLVFCLLASPALALQPLSEVDRLNDGLRDVKIADEIRSKCDGISARMVQAWARLNGLKSHVRSLGYADDDIEDFVTSKSERARLEKEAEGYMRKNGVVRGDMESYCALGRTEIANSSAIGQLLRER